jgi:energy-converting hydrogenase Eha subunit F
MLNLQRVPLALVVIFPLNLSLVALSQVKSQEKYHQHERFTEKNLPNSEGNIQTPMGPSGFQNGTESSSPGVQEALKSVVSRSVNQ